MGSRVTVTVDGLEVFAGPLDRKDGPAGAARYGIEIPGPAGAWRIRGVIDVTHETEENGIVEGFLSFHNGTSVPRDFSVELLADGCPLILGACEAGGVVKLTARFNEDGGIVSVPFGETGFRALVDGDVEAELFTGPFFLQGSGQGVASTTSDYGQPSPGLFVGSMNRDFGFVAMARVTRGETAIFEFQQVVGGPASSFEPCSPPAAFDSPDGLFDPAELIDAIQGIFAQWGSCQRCAYDLNDDGWVDGLDLLAVLSG
ncbi:MAG: hypothetical protein AB8G96_11515 [Phycisphaerales bacterium]